MRSRKKIENNASFLIGKPAFQYWQILKPIFNGFNIYQQLPINLVEVRTAAECPIPGKCPGCSRHHLCWGFSFPLRFLLRSSEVPSSSPLGHRYPFPVPGPYSVLDSNNSLAPFQPKYMNVVSFPTLAFENAEPDVSWSAGTYKNSSSHFI